MALACVGAENAAMSNLKQSTKPGEPIKDIAIFVSSCQCLGLHVLVLQLLNGEGDRCSERELCGKTKNSGLGG